MEYRCKQTTTTRGRRLFDSWTEIVSHGTQCDDPTTLRYRRRPSRKPCEARLTIFFDFDNNDVLWFCPCCHDEGRIAGWYGTFWDNGELVLQRPS